MDFNLLRKLLELRAFRVVIDCKFQGDEFKVFTSFLSRELRAVIDQVVVQAYCDEDVDALAGADIKHCLVALWKFHDGDPFSADAVNLVGHAARSGLHATGISLRYRNPTTGTLNVENPRLPNLQKWGIPLFIHGQEAELTMMAAVGLNERFPLFASRSYGELPLDFDVQAYLARYADLRRFSPRAAAAHYIAFGKKEGRKYLRANAP